MRDGTQYKNEIFISESGFVFSFLLQQNLIRNIFHSTQRMSGAGCAKRARVDTKEEKVPSQAPKYSMILFLQAKHSSLLMSCDDFMLNRDVFRFFSGKHEIQDGDETYTLEFDTLDDRLYILGVRGMFAPRFVRKGVDSLIEEYRKKHSNLFTYEIQYMISEIQFCSQPLVQFFKK